MCETLCYSTIPATHCGKWTKRYQQCAINTKHRGENTPCVKLNTSWGHAHWVSTGTAAGGHFAQKCSLAKLSKVLGCPDSYHTLYVEVVNLRIQKKRRLIFIPATGMWPNTCCADTKMEINSESKICQYDGKCPFLVKVVNNILSPENVSGIFIKYWSKFKRWFKNPKQWQGQWKTKTIKWKRQIEYSIVFLFCWNCDTIRTKKEKQKARNERQPHAEVERFQDLFEFHRIAPVVVVPHCYIEVN